MRAIGLLLLALAFGLAPAPPPSLRIWSVNNLGRADLLPGDTMQIVIELRSDVLQDAQAQHLPPAGLTPIGATASNGAIVVEPFPSWSGQVGPDQPVNLVITERVLAGAEAGDRETRAQAELGGQLLTATTTLRICCTPAPPARYLGPRLFFPVFRA